MTTEQTTLNKTESVTKMFPLYYEKGNQSNYKIKVNVNNNSVFMYLVKRIIKDDSSDDVSSMFYIVIRKLPTVANLLSLTDNGGKPIYLSDDSWSFIASQMTTEQTPLKMAEPVRKMFSLYYETGSQSNYKIKVHVNDDESVCLYLMKRIIKDDYSDASSMFYIVIRTITLANLLNLQDYTGKNVYLSDEALGFIDSICQ